MNRMAGAGMELEALGSTKIGDVPVERFAVKVTGGAPNPYIQSFYGKKSEYAIGVMEDRVRVVMGDEAYIRRSYQSGSSKPITSSSLVQESLSKLPSTRNAVVLFNPMGLLPLLGPLMGGQVRVQEPGTAPVAISVSLAGNPARVDVRVPFETVEKAVKAFSPDTRKSGGRK